MTMAWSLNAESEVRDIGRVLARARDAWVESNPRDVATDAAKTQIAAATAAAMAFLQAGGGGVHRVAVAMSGDSDEWLTAGTFSLSVVPLPEEKPTLGELHERDPDAPRETAPEAAPAIVAEVLPDGAEPRGVTMLPAGLQAQIDAETKAAEARAQVAAGVRDPSFAPPEDAPEGEQEPEEAGGSDPEGDEDPEEDDEPSDDDAEPSSGPTKAELQERLRDLGLPTSGNKADLEARLAAAEEDA